MQSVKKFFQDKNGKWTIGQFPNLPIAIWAVLTVISLLMAESPLRTNIEQLKAAVLLVWAYLEVSDGDSGFRRLLGGIVLLFIVYGYFV